MQIRCRTLLVVTSLLTACATQPKTPPPSTTISNKSPSSLPAVNPLPDPHTASKPGGYYLDDGPPGDAIDLTRIPEPVPQDEPEHPRANNPYSVAGEVVVPERGRKSYSAKGVASWYGKRFHGRKTSSGEKYDMYAFSAAHRTLPIPSYARVTNLKNGKSVIVRVNDRGPFHKKRLIDLSYAAASKLDYIDDGSVDVHIERIFPGDMPILASNQTDIEAPISASLAETGQLPNWDSSKTYWQLGAFKQESSAKTFADSIRKHLPKGQNVLIASAPPLYRVLAGPYVDESKAQRDFDRIASALGSSPVLYRPTRVASNP